MLGQGQILGCNNVDDEVGDMGLLLILFILKVVIVQEILFIFMGGEQIDYGKKDFGVSEFFGECKIVVLFFRKKNVF